ncbi:MAG: BatD family protein, partial [Desulfobacterales bacterium]|nr:BatD family protein [Desulfobacterales bacterium]
MKQKLKHIGVLSLLVINLIGLKGQDVTFTANAPKYLRQGEQFNLTYTTNKSVKNLKAPNLNDFQYLGGPATGSSTSIQVVNGQTTRTASYTYTFYLRAAKSGTFNIAPATAEYGGKTITSNSLSVEVVGSGNQQQGGGSSSGSGNTSTPSASGNTQSSGEDLFVRLHMDKRTAYVGEQVTAWVKIYTKVNLSAVDDQFGGPDMTGFFKQPVDVPPLRQLEREKVGNELYHSGLVYKVILYPQKTGEITIPSFEYKVGVQQQTNQQRSIFDDFFGSSYRTVQVDLKSKPVKMKILPLPANGRPADFSGAVGNFSVSSSVNTNELVTNDA